MAAGAAQLVSEVTTIKSGKRTHREVYKVKCSSATDKTTVALTASGLPAPMSAHASGDGTYYTSIEAKKVDRSISTFEITCDAEVPEVTGTPDPDPLSRPPEYDWSPAEFTEPYMEDKSDPVKPVLNTAKEPYDQFLERSAAQQVITITRNEATNTGAVVDGEFFVNTDSVTIDGTSYAEGTLKIGPPRIRKMQEVVNGSLVTYYQKTYILHYKKGGWDQEVESRGYSQLDEGKRKPIVDDAKQQVTKPWPLDADGKAKANPTDAPAKQTFVPYTKTAFSPLGFT